MEIIKKDFDGIEYYLIDIYEDKFSFGTVYHFASDIGQKYCFYQDNTYIPIENKKYLKEIKQKLEFYSDIIYDKINIKKKIIDILTIDILRKRLDSEEEYKLYDKAAKTINELYPNISYTDKIKVLNDDSGIYYSKLPKNINGNYNITNNKIYLVPYANPEELEETILHESIHKLTNRNGFIKDNWDYIGLIEAATAKICENKYGDKTSHKIFGGNNEIHVNFSTSFYELAQVIYRQMAQLVDVQMADEELIKGNFDIFLNKFEEMYGKDLLVYLSHRASILVFDHSLSEEKQLAYLDEAQDMLLTVAFNKKLVNVKTEEDMINYMAELKKFEYTRARIKNGGYTFDNYYIDKYNYVIDLARQRGINVSKLKEFEYSEYSRVEFLPVRNHDKIPLSEFTQRHISEMCNIPVEILPNQELNLERCTRMKIGGLPNCYGLDVVLQDRIPISVLYEEVFYGGSSNVIKLNKISDIFEEFDVDNDNSEIYGFANDTYMIISSDGTCEVYGIDSETSKICRGIENQIDLGFNLEDINRYKEKNAKASKTSLLSRIKNLFRKEEVPILLNASSSDTANKSRKSFLNQLNPNNGSYNDNPVTLTESLNPQNGEVVRGDTPKEQE